MNTIKKIEYRNHTISIHPDTHPMNPREECVLGIMATKHSRYNLGDKNDVQIKDPIEFLEGMLGKEPSYEQNNERVRELEDEFFEKYIARRVYMYEHSGIALSTSSFRGRAHHAEWDSGQIGWIYMDKDTALKEIGGETDEEKIKRAYKILDAEIETYSKYVNGEVYGYTVEGDYCDDSSWGYYDEEYMIQEAKRFIDYDVQKEMRKQQERTKAYIRHSVPLDKRQPTTV